MSQAHLLTGRRFAPFFWVSFLTAFNDNVFKQAMVTYVTMKGLQFLGLNADVLVAVSTVVVVSPFLLLSATAGQALDRYPKARSIGIIKFAEILVMILGVFALVEGDVGLMMLTLLLAGTQSTFFGPAKYSILPELLREEELVAGNALIETGTFVSVLVGTIVGGSIMARYGVESGPTVTASAIVGVAIFGWMLSLLIPETKPGNPELKIQLNPITPNVEILKRTKEHRPIFWGILGISWFWFVGSAMLSIVPSYGAMMLGGNPYAITFFTALFSIGVGAGSLLCARLSRGYIETGMVPLGGFGMTIFLIDLAVVGSPSPPGGAEVALVEFAMTFTGARVMFDLTMLAIFGGLMTVPQYTLIQAWCPQDVRSRVMAGMNIITSLFVLLGGAYIILLLSLGAEARVIFAILAGLQLAAAVVMYKATPKGFYQLIIRFLARYCYRFTYTGIEHVPVEGPAILACNHVTYIDWLFISAAVRRPPQFVMSYMYMNLPLMDWFAKETDIIPIAPKTEGKDTLEQAYERIHEAIQIGDLVGLFPEGSLTRTGKMNPFKRGVEKILQRDPVPVIPMALVGVWGSFFSRYGGKAMSKPFRRVFSRIELRIGEPMPPDSTAHEIALRIAQLGGYEPPPSEEVSEPSTPAPEH